MQDDCTLLSAAIAFYTLLSLAPSLYLIGVGLSAVFEGIDTSQQIVVLIAKFLPPAAVPTVERVQNTLQIRGDLVIVAVPGLLWTATHAVSSFEYALNIAFARNSGLRRIWRSRAKGFVVLIADPLRPGAVMATVGWEGARQLFGLLLQSSPAFGLLTGTLAGVLAFLFWIYTGLAIVLLGAQFAAVLNGDRWTDAPR